MKTKAKTFDLESVYDEKIAPLVTEIIKICQEHHLPMVASFLYKSDPEGIGDGDEMLCSTVLGFDDHKLTNTLAMVSRILLEPRSGPMMRVVVRDAEGKVISQEIIP